MPETQKSLSPRFSGIRLRRRRLFEGCAILLLISTVAALMPWQHAAPTPTVSLAPVAAPSLARPQAPPVQAAAHLPTRHRLPSLSSFHPLAALPAIPHLPTISRLSALSGLASWYGKNFGGHHTASGEIFDPKALTACHRSLPFGTLVRVVNLVNNRSVLVRINDRGVLNTNRVIDLSSGAAEQLDMLRAGVAHVRLEVLSMPGGQRSAAPQPALAAGADADSELPR